MSRWAWLRRMRGEERDRPTQAAQPEPGPSAASPRQREMARLRREARQAATDFWTAPSAEQAEVHTFTYRKAKARLRELKAEEVTAHEFEDAVKGRPGWYFDPRD